MEADGTLDSRYFDCLRLHAKIPKSTCLARQFSLVRGTRSFLFPECGSCSQGKVIAQEHQNVIGGEKEKSLMVDQTKSGNEAREGGARLCQDCGEKPPMSPHSPYCSSCMQKRATKARMKSKKASKREKEEAPAVGPGAHRKEAFRAGRVIMPVDFGRYREVLEAVVKLAEEEMRPLEIQIVFMLKSCLKRPGAAL